MSQTCCLIMGQLNSSSPWGEKSYGRDYGCRYSLSSLAYMKSCNWNGAILGSILNISAASYILSSETWRFSSSLIFFCMGSWLWSNFVWNPCILLKLHYNLKVFGISLSDLFPSNFFYFIKFNFCGNTAQDNYVFSTYQPPLYRSTSL